MTDGPSWGHYDGADVLDVGEVVAVVLKHGSAGRRRWCWLVGGGAPEHDSHQDAETRLDAMIAAERHLLERGFVTAHDLARLATTSERGRNER